MGIPYHKLEAQVRGRVLWDEPLANHTSFGIGGPADLLVFPEDLGDLREVLRFCSLESCPLLPIGNGTNLLVRDGGWRGVGVSLKDGFRELRVKERGVTCGGGALLQELVSLASDSSLTGIEFLAGIPGTVGGAIRRNAGAWGEEISGYLVSLKGMDRSGETVELRGDRIKFGYRETNLPDDLIIFQAHLGLKRDSEGRKLVNHYLGKREETQPLGQRSAGSVFKNPPGEHAARLIEEAGCKGLKVGGAQVSPKHANFIVNPEDATARDVLSLIQVIKERVRTQAGVELELEVEVIGVE